MIFGEKLDNKINKFLKNQIRVCTRHFLHARNGGQVSEPHLQNCECRQKAIWIRRQAFICEYLWQGIRPLLPFPIQRNAPVSYHTQASSSKSLARAPVSKAVPDFFNNNGKQTESHTRRCPTRLRYDCIPSFPPLNSSRHSATEKAKQSPSNSNKPSTVSNGAVDEDDEDDDEVQANDASDGDDASEDDAKGDSKEEKKFSSIQQVGTGLGYLRWALMWMWNVA